MELRVQNRREEGVAVLAAAGEVDIFSAPDLDSSLSELIAAGNAHVVVDLTEVTFLDSTGLGVFVKALKALRDVDGSLHLVVTSERIRKVFEVTGLDASLPVFDSVEAAAAR